MSKGNKKKAAALGMSYGAAANRLRKMILFSLVCRLKLNVCYQCDSEILSVNDISIEHKNPWIQADNPVESFFDLNNIAFSHLSCNIGAASKPNKKYFTEEEKHRGQIRRNKKRWQSLGKEEQQKIRREQYLRTGK